MVCSGKSFGLLFIYIYDSCDHNFLKVPCQNGLTKKNKYKIKNNYIHVTLFFYNQFLIFIIELIVTHVRMRLLPVQMVVLNILQTLKLLNFQLNAKIIDIIIAWKKLILFATKVFHRTLFSYLNKNKIRFKFWWKKSRLGISSPQNFEIIHTIWSSVWGIKKHLWTQSFHFCLKSWSLSVFHGFKSSKRDAGHFFDDWKQKTWCVFTST